MSRWLWLGVLLVGCAREEAKAVEQPPTAEQRFELFESSARAYCESECEGECPGGVEVNLCMALLSKGALIELEVLP